MNLTRISTGLLPVFSTFLNLKVPDEIVVQSRSGDTSMLYDLPDLGFAVVGTRFPQKRSLEVLEEGIAGLKNSGLIIVSGFARGIDARAHELAIQYGLRTVAILGSGINLTYPRENARLRDAIINSGGLVISQFADDAIAYASNFHRRNEVIAGFSKAVWVVEAAAVSGTLNTASAALKLERDIYATSCFPKDQFYQGNLKLLSEKDSHRYPIAIAYYHHESLSRTWGTRVSADVQPSFALNLEAKTQIQRWVIELQASAGECRVQTLMNYASDRGYTLGQFYQNFEAEVSQGLLRYDASGLVEILA